MRVLAVDPGTSSGIVIVDSTKDVIFHHTVEMSELHRWLLIAGNHVPTHLVIEAPPSKALRHYKDAWWETASILHTIFPLLSQRQVMPGEWKPLEKALKRKTDTTLLLTQHERDAACLGRYFLRTLGGYRVETFKS